MAANTRLSLLYVSYLTLGMTLPFLLPAHMTQKVLNESHSTIYKGRSNPRCIFSRLI
ncbi:hypothetical protein HG536_0D01140 [Torulaspora globosa]|uniref:Uncharacterized protein n=1 Tax=Torulaspora globosa TaxID=48254 RepID=A0A7G3ZGF6_9SACH|nr:uncharacterized protein HG536_0D01140 [Torulaspora globosa]QLL32592.1 hypothetical protein HG536_0D01140 [Torulaspora globosa]